MGGDMRVSDFATKTLTEVVNFADEIHQRVLDKQDRYNEFAKNKTIFENTKNRALMKYRAAQAKYKNNPNSILSSARTEYASAEEKYRCAEINFEISASGLQDELSYYTKMQAPATIAENMLA